MEYKKAESVLLRDLGKDEKWLQQQIYDDPSIIGLGDLRVITRERTQSAGGRLDFLMYDPEDSTRFEVEVMLGTLDESHIIRTIEYWDIERRRYPTLDHRAVIIAEEITNRFFNIISLMNKSIPIIAIQLDVFKHGNDFFLNFVKVLDLADSGDDEETEVQEKVEREAWVEWANPKSIELFDALVGLVKPLGEPKITYNSGHIAVGTSGQQFMWCHPRKSANIFLVIRVGEENRDALAARFDEQGIECVKEEGRVNRIKVRLTAQEFQKNQALIREAITLAESFSH
jgi:hypothetical protein